MWTLSCILIPVLFFLTAVSCSPRGGLLHEREVIIQIMDFLRQRETSRDLYVLSPSFFHMISPLHSLSYQDPTFTQMGRLEGEIQRRRGKRLVEIVSGRQQQ